MQDNNTCCNHAAGPTPTAEEIHMRELTAYRTTVQNQGAELSALRARCAELTEEVEHESKWRDLALQFDGHRMQALWHLKAVLHADSSADQYKAAEQFLAAPPLSGEKVLAQRIAELEAKAQSAPQAAPAAVAVPEGWALVPLEATQEMIEAWGNATELPEGMAERSDDEVNAYAAQRDWKAMLAVAPAVVAVPDERSAFEAWAESVGLDHLVRGFGKQDDYAFVETRRMWEAWQGRAALEAKQELQWPDPVAHLVERHSFRASPDGQDAEGNSWLEECEAGEPGAFAVYTEQQVRAILKRGFPVSNGESNDD